MADAPLSVFMVYCLPVFHIAVEAKCLASKFVAFFIENLHTEKIKPAGNLMSCFVI